MKKPSEDALSESLHQEIAALERLIGEGPPAQAGVLRAAAEKLRIAAEELHVAEEELRQQNEELLATRDEVAAERARYQDLFDLAPDGYLVTDPKGMIREANQAAGDLFNLPPRQLVGKPLAVFVPREGERAFRLLVARSNRSTRPLRWELGFQPRHREAFPASVTVTLDRDGDGDPMRLRWLLRDVTEETLAREELAASRQLLEAHLDNSPLAVVEFAPDFRVLRWSLGAERLFGWTAAEVAGRAIEELRWVHEEDAEAVRRVSGALLDGTNPRNRHANRNYRKDGAVVHCEWYNSAIYDAQGRLASILSLVLDVTERVRAQEALAKSEALFRRTFDQAPIGGAMVGLDGKFRRVNEALCAILGYREEELLGLGWEEITHPDDLPGNRENARALLNGTLDLYQTEKRYLRRDGRPVWASASVRLIRDETGAPVYLLPMLQDISERRRLQQELRDSWERYTLAESIVHFGTWERDLENDASFWSPECYRIFGRDPDLGPPDFEELLSLVQPEDRERVREVVGQAMAEDRKVDVMYRVVRPDGEERVIRSVAQPLDGEGGPPRRLLGALQDVTEATRAEAELRESERRLRTLADALPVLVWTARPYGAVDYFNTRIEEYAAVARGEGGTWDWPPLIHPADRERTERAWADAAQRSEVYQIDHRVRMGDGGYRWHLTRAVPLTDAQGQVVKWFGTSTDIGALKDAEEELRRARDAAEAATAAKSQFLANMSHEIRTPLAGILGMTEILGDTSLSAEQGECVDAIRLSGKLLLGVVNDVLDLSRIESAGVALDSVEFALRNALEETVHLQAEAAHAKGLELCCRVGEGVPARVHGDPGRLRQILFNLVGNAVKFTDQGQVVVRADLLGEPGERAMIRVEVEDTGIGIPEAVQGRLFQTFTQGDASTTRRFGGSGLGLAICKRLVEAMGGELGLRSTPGVGSTFWFTVPFPVAAGAPEAEPLPAGLRALAVVAHPVSRGFLVEQLARLGAEAEGASGRAEALRLAAQAGEEGRPFRVALVELDLPEGSGRDLGKELESPAGQPAPAVVLLAPFTSRGLAAKVQEEDGCSFLLKPVREGDLGRCLGAILAGRSLSPPGRELPATVEEPRGDRGTVLVAEDNPVIQAVLVRFLKRLGYRSRTVEDGAAAVEAALAARYDLVLMDWQMPCMDGLEAAREIRRREDPARRVPIVALTAHALAEHREQCLAAGMEGYLSKPVDLADLAQALDRWAGGTQEGETRDGETGGEEADAPDGFARVASRLTELERHIGSSAAWKIVDLFLQHGPERLASLRQALERADAAGVAWEAHALRGTCSALAAGRIMELAAGVEYQAERGLLEGAEDAVSRLAEELERLCSHLEARRPDLAPGGTGAAADGRAGTEEP